VTCRGARVDRLEQGDFHKVFASIESSNQEFTARLVVGADGRNSNVRTCGGLSNRHRHTF